MITLEVNNSTSKISGFTIQEYRDFRYLLSYTISEQKSYFLGYGSGTKYLIDKKGNFNTGLLPIVYEYLKTFNKKHAEISYRHPPKRARIDFKTLSNMPSPYACQQAAIDACRAFERGTVTMPTGSGKSLTIAKLVQALGVRTLIVVPNLGLKQQLTESFKSWFKDIKHITIENIDSPTLQKTGDYDLLIVDEAHHSAANTYQELNKTRWQGIYYRFFFTATPYRSDPDEQLLLESIAGQVIYSLTYHEAVEQNIICPIRAFYVEAPKIKISGRKWSEVYNELIVNNSARNDLITELLVKFHVDKIPTLCLVKEIKHGKILSNDGAFNFSCGADKDSKENINLFNNGEITTLIGTTGVLGEGVDTKPAEIVIIAGMGKSQPQFVQMVGRVLRKSLGKSVGAVILIKDSSHKFGKSHFNSQVKYLKESYNISPIKIEFDAMRNLRS